MRKNIISFAMAGGLALAPQALVGQKPEQQKTEQQKPEQQKPEQQKPEQQKPEIPLAEPPQDLIGVDGKVELDLVDPFQRGVAGSAEKEGSEGMSSTTMGQISQEFRILAILIPEDEFRPPMALIRLRNELSPQVVKKGDLIQISQRPVESRKGGRAPDRAHKDGGQASLGESALKALESYSFYLHIKDIKATSIEAYQKKSPKETFILSW